jgi:uroporphyrinogen-III decarboxylase
MAEELLKICVSFVIESARQQVLAGADVIDLGDAVASLLSPQMYRNFALPYEQRIFCAVDELGRTGTPAYLWKYHPFPPGCYHQRRQHDRSGLDGGSSCRC